LIIGNGKGAIEAAIRTGEPNLIDSHGFALECGGEQRGEETSPALD